MKSLNEELNEIKNMKASLKTKKEALIKLGLSKYEVELVMQDMPKTVRERHTFTFGVEIECLMSHAAFANTESSRKIQYFYQSYNHIDNDRYYKFVSDGSIRGNNPIECVSPVLTGKKGFESLENCCKALNEAGAQVNVSTGLHVHIGAQNLTDEAYINVFVNYQRLERVIDSFMANSRRGNGCRWCHSLIGRNLGLCRTKDTLLYALNNDRYFKVNPCSYERHKTIEFRQHQGSTDFVKISNWVNFCAKLVAWSKKNRLQNEVASIDDIPFLTVKEKSYFKSRAEALR